MIDVAADPHPALRATFSRKREKGFPDAARGLVRMTKGSERPLSRLRERVEVRVNRSIG